MTVRKLLVGFTVVVAASCGDGDGAGTGSRSAGPRYAQIDRCTVRLLDAPAEERAALEAAARARLGKELETVRLTHRGERVRDLVLTGAPAPATPPESNAEAEAAARAALQRYRGVFGDAAAALPPARLYPFRRRMGLMEWSVSGSQSARSRSHDVHVTLEASGAPRSLIVEELWPEPPADAICEHPRVALDDPRIRAAVVGAKVRDWPPMGEPRDITFAATDLGEIRTTVILFEQDVFRRVIEVDLKDRMWTARLDADTARLLRIDANFVY